MRVVLAGCGVRESERAGLRGASRPWTCSCGPTRSPSWRSDSAWSRLRRPWAFASVPRPRRPPWPDGPSAPPTGWPPTAPPPWPKAAWPAPRRSPPGCRSSTAATRPAPTASSRSRAGPSAAGRSTTSWPRRAAIAAAGFPELTLLGQNVNSYGHDLPAEERFGAHRHRRVTPAGELDLRARPDLAELLRVDRRHPRRRRQARHLPPALHHLAPVGSLRPADRSHGTNAERLRAPAPAGPVGRRRDAPARMGRQYTVAHYRRAPGSPARGRPRPGRLHGRHRRLLRRDRGAVRGHAAAAAGRALRHGLRRGLLAATRHAGPAHGRRRSPGGEATAPQRAARGASRRSASSATRHGSVATWRSSSNGSRPASAARVAPTTSTTRGDALASASRAWRARRGRGASPWPDARATTSWSTSPVTPALVGRLVSVHVDYAGPFALRGRGRGGPGG